MIYKLHRLVIKGNAAKPNRPRRVFKLAVNRKLRDVWHIVRCLLRPVRILSVNIMVNIVKYNGAEQSA